MRTFKNFLNVSSQLGLGLVLGAFRRGEYYDRQTEHLSRKGYAVFLIALIIVLAGGIAAFIGWR